MITRAVVRVLSMCSPDYFKSRQTDRVTLWDPHEWTPQKLAIPSSYAQKLQYHSTDTGF